GNIGRPMVSKKTCGTSMIYCNALALEAFLNTVQAKAYEAKHKLIIESKPVTAMAIRTVLQGKEDPGKRPKYLIELFITHNERMKRLVSKQYAKGTLVKYQTVLKHTRAFIEWKYNCQDIDIKQLNFEFVSDLAFWLKA